METPFRNIYIHLCFTMFFLTLSWICETVVDFWPSGGPDRNMKISKTYRFLLTGPSEWAPEGKNITDLVEGCAFLKVNFFNSKSLPLSAIFAFSKKVSVWCESGAQFERLTKFTSSKVVQKLCVFDK